MVDSHTPAEGVVKEASNGSSTMLHAVRCAMVVYNVLDHITDSSRIINSNFLHNGGVAQMVERSLSMREVPGSIPGASKFFFFLPANFVIN